MAANASRRSSTPQEKAAQTPAKLQLPGQVVLVLQGGGALGAYQIGVYQAMHEAGIEPDWVIGTSIGAINAALICGNRPGDRLDRLHAFWNTVEVGGQGAFPLWPKMDSGTVNLTTMLQGVPGFFKPNPASFGNARQAVGVDAAGYYTTAPLRETLSRLVDFEYLATLPTRLTVGAVNVRTGKMRYFDSKKDKVGLDEIMASGAIPPAFPAVRIDGEAYWDGGIYSNTPIEAVLDDNPRRDSVIFAVNVWQQQGGEPASIWEVMGRQKDIQFGSRDESHIERQRQTHRLRHIIRELAKHLPVDKCAEQAVKELTAWGCGTTMHIAMLDAPQIPGEDHMKDIDFTAAGVLARRNAGYEDALQMLKRAPWQEPVDPIEGMIVHHLPSRR